MSSQAPPLLGESKVFLQGFDSLIEAEFGRGVAAEIISLLERWARLLVEGRVDQGKAAVSGPT